MTHYYEVYKIVSANDMYTDEDVDYKGSCEAVAFDTLDEAIEYADKNSITSITEIGGSWIDYEKCSFCDEWFDSCELNKDGECQNCQQAIKSHGGV